MARIRTQNISRGDVTADLSRQISRCDVTFSRLYTPCYSEIKDVITSKSKGRCCGAHSALPALKADCTLAPEVVPSVIFRGAPHQAAREASISERRKQNARILPTTRNFTAVVGVFDMSRSWNMGQII
jgi:hypothetical protein